MQYTCLWLLLTFSAVWYSGSKSVLVVNAVFDTERGADKLPTILGFLATFVRDCIP